jgi:hypothetical protein
VIRNDAIAEALPRASCEMTNDKHQKRADRSACGAVKTIILASFVRGPDITEQSGRYNSAHA